MPRNLVVNPAALPPESGRVRRCKEAGDDPRHAKRPAPHPGPRCATCHRAVLKSRRLAAHAARTERVYGISGELYWSLYEAQGGCCAICRRARGLTKRLAVDHDHACCPGPTSCGQCIRGLLCSSCNQLLGRMRDSAEVFDRAAAYLREPLARH